MGLIMKCLSAFSVSAILVFTLEVASDLHHRQKRFVFYPGSVVQLAAGLAIPAEVPNKIIYTNYGIMINYGLPTNLSSLSPLTFVEDARATSSWDQLSRELFHKFGLNRACWDTLKHWAENDDDSSLRHHLTRIILSEIERNELLKNELLRDSSAAAGCSFLHISQ